MREFKIDINNRPTIIMYNKKVNIEQAIKQVLIYQEKNKRKLNLVCIGQEDIVIIDEEYKLYKDNNGRRIFIDNKPYKVLDKPFKPKSKFRKMIEKIIKK